MRMTGHYHLVLQAGADADAFEALFADEGMRDVLRSTRITSGFDTRLLRATGERPGDGDEGDVFAGRRYLWQVDVTLMTGAGYRYGENIEALQQRVDGLATVYGLHIFSSAAETD